MSRERIAERLKAAMGLHSPTVGMVTITNAIDRRMRACNIDSYEKYLSRIVNSSDEMKELIEAVIIPETWFFREQQPYEYLLKHCHDIKRNASRGPIRILSAPCSTGEEPYSIAMTLIDNGFKPDEFIIDAVDIGEKHIERAHEGRYRQHAFRSNDLSFVERHFTKEDVCYLISQRVKDAVSFQCANILDEEFNCGFAIYDIIFCRNLLIYFDKETQKQVFSTLNRLLKNDGILILGHAETVQHSEGLFTPVMDAKAYIHIKSDNPVAAKPAKPVNETRSIRKPKVPRAFADIKPQSPRDTQTQLSASNTKLEDAFVLANEGELDKALDICVQYLSSEPLSPRAHYLAGIIYDSKGDADDAGKYLRKTIYLDPNHHEALIHLSLMAEQSGNSEEATRLRDRAQRVQKRGSKT